MGNRLTSLPEKKIEDMKLFRCKNCGITIKLNAQASRLLQTTDGIILSNSRCFCDEEHGVLVYISKR